MSTSPVIIPTRFLSLTAHFITTVTLFWSREPNVLACVPQDSFVGSDLYRDKDIQLITGLSLMLALLIVEYAGFLSGLSLFNSSLALVSSIIHTAACVVLLFFHAQAWNCDSFWYILVACSITPAGLELVTDAVEIKFRL